jgi:hypothetical protein
VRRVGKKKQMTSAESTVPASILVTERGETGDVATDSTAVSSS